MNRESIESEARFQACVDVLASVIGHAECNGPLQDYCTGLLLPVERKSVEPMSAMTAIAVLGCCVLTGLSELAKNFPKSSLPGWFRLKQYLVQKKLGQVTRQNGSMAAQTRAPAQTWRTTAASIPENQYISKKFERDFSEAF